MIEHKVESGRDVILDGSVFHPDINKRVFLPRLFATDECVPVEEKPPAPEKNTGGRKPNTAANTQPEAQKAQEPVVPDSDVAGDMDARDIEEALNG